MTHADKLKTLTRGLEALANLNINGPMNLAEQVRATGLTRSTMGRIVRTLVDAGYCVRLPNSTKYSVTALVQRLAVGFTDAERLTSVASSPLVRLGKVLEWPLALLTPHGTDMLVQLATDRNTSLALTRAVAGDIAPMLKTATGTFYLSLIDEARRRDFLSIMPADGSIKRYCGSEGRLSALLAKAHRDKCLIFADQSSEAVLSVPIMPRERPLGCLRVRYIRSAISRDEAINRFLPYLRATAREIELSLQQTGNYSGRTDLS